MGEAGAPGALVLRADVVPHVHGHDRHVVVFVDDDVEAVGEGALLERKRQGTAHRTGMSGIFPRLASAVLCAMTDTCAAVRPATVKNARAAADAGSPTTSGTPVSPPSRIGW